MLIYSLFLLTVYALVTPNVGNLYRFRYPFFMLLVCLSATSAVYLVYRKIISRQRAKSDTKLDLVEDHSK